MNEEPLPVRLDIRVSEQLGNKSRSYANKLIKLGNVKVNNIAVLKPSYMVGENDSVDINDQLEPQNAIEFKPEIIFEDDSCVVINKPVGMLTHSKGEFYPEETIATFIRPKLSKDFNGTNRDGIVHRLDRATSGVILCAKTPEAEKWYKSQFSTRKASKTYLAVVSGVPKNEKAVIDLPIERNPKKPQFFRVGANGKPSQTEYEVIASKLHNSHRYSLIQLRPHTGRTHQLRVHLNYINCPILGDTFYDGEKYLRLMLHAHKLSIKLFDDKSEKEFMAGVPKEFKDLFDVS